MCFIFLLLKFSFLNSAQQQLTDEQEGFIFYLKLHLTHTANCTIKLFTVC